MSNISAKNRVEVIYTGGTIGMVPSDQGLVPSAGFSDKLAEMLGKTNQLANVEWEMEPLDPLLDSANMQPDQWFQIARVVREKAQLASRVVVLHGTDTLAYTGSALSYLLLDLDIPVVLTGSQHPFGLAGSDAVDNFMGALVSDAEQGVSICFADQMLPANRTIKWDAEGLNAFKAPENGSFARKVDTGFSGFQSRKWLDFAQVRVEFYRVMPGISTQTLSLLVENPPQGLVLSVYGAGTLPNTDAAFLAALKSLKEKGTVILAISQCQKGRLDFDRYAAGSPFNEVGAVNGQDMTVEAAFTKMMVLLKLGYSGEELEALLGQNLAGELCL